MWTVIVFCCCRIEDRCSLCAHFLHLLMHLLVSGLHFESQVRDSEPQLRVALVDLHQLLL